MVALKAGAGVTGDALDGDGVIGEADVGGPFDIGEDVGAVVGSDVAGVGLLVGFAVGTGVGCNRIRFMC